MSKVALVTGASRGLGLAITQRFASAGMEVVACARNMPTVRLNSTLIWQMVADVSSADRVAFMVDQIQHQLKQIDVLVCNAGVYRGSWREMIQTNVIGTILCIQAVMPIMQRQGYGKIITLSGGGVGGKSVSGLSVYAASKAAVVQYTETLAAELPKGITINAVAPGLLDSDVQREKAVDLIEWLASADSDGITGRLLSAVHDDWRSFGPLAETDYRLRRMVPDPDADRLPPHLQSWHGVGT